MVRNSAYLLGVCLLLQSNMLTLASEAIPALSSFDSNLSPKPGDATSTSSTSDGSVMPEFAKMTLADSGQLLSKLESTFSDQAADRAPLPAASEALNVAGEQTTNCRAPILPSTGVCGGAPNFDSIIVRDNGDGTAIYQANIGNVPSSGAPTQPLYPNPCNLLNADLIIIMRKGSSAPYVSPDINRWLTTLGIGSPQVIAGTLTVYADHTPNALTVPISPVFLATLQQVGAVVVSECANCNADPNVPPTGPSVLTALPGLVNVLKFWNFKSNNGQPATLKVSGTAFSDMASFSGLQCSPGFLSILNNRGLFQLTGLESMTTPIRPGPTVQILNNSLPGAASIQALRTLASCPSGTTSALSSPTQIVTGLCSIPCWTTYCTFVNTRVCASCNPAPPPPPATCFPPQNPVPGCGNITDKILVRDNGDGTCTSQTIFGSCSTPGSCTIVGSCSTPVYGQTCLNVLGSITVIIRRSTTSVAYQRPQIQKWLTQMGLGSARIIARPLTVQVDHTPNPVPPFINPVFLTSLSQVAAIVVYECANCGTNVEIGPAAPALQSLPGLINVRQMRDFDQQAGILGSLVVRNTAMTGLESFSGLRCTPGFINLVNNKALAALSGLDGIGYSFFTPGPVVNAVGNALTSPATINQLIYMAGCGGKTIASQVAIDAAGCIVRCWSTYCAYSINGTCPACSASPPPPPRPPTSPPPPPPPVLPSPPPPPIPRLCPVEITKAAPICGETLQRITLTFSASTCTGYFKNFPALSSSTEYNCAAARPFGATVCGSFLGSVLITLAPDFPTGASTLAQTYLTQLGIQNINWVQNLLVGHDVFTGQVLRPTMFPNLAYVSGIFGITAFVSQLALIFDQIQGFAAPMPTSQAASNASAAMPGEAALRYGLPGVVIPPTGLGLASLPGQTALQGVGNLLVIYGSSFTDLASLSGLRCAGTIWLSENPTLTTLNGLDLISVPPGGFNYDYDFGLPYQLAMSQAGLAPLQPISGCVDGPFGPFSTLNDYFNGYVNAGIPPIISPCYIVEYGQICRANFSASPPLIISCAG